MTHARATHRKTCADTAVGVPACMTNRCGTV
jgi:hypothetical protein